ncbi:hypothetical protein BGZ99_007663 [Dissophora globulifera]|uniref:CCHC-type domain-containing protein n=1 Tax=Dissophora globulifera TaxID=979702 RepID=A0A9P6UPF4_9FUNG|nr:hypothetical protein BGZ99_007663 [Dissophora globulifera]
MSESDLNLPTIVPLLQPKTSATSTKPGTEPRQSSSSASQSDPSIMQHPHLVPSSLKVETALLTKELSKFRACDQNTCFYCREWAQFVFKKTFGKDKTNPTTDKKGSRPGGLGAGAGAGSAASGSEPKKKHKEYAMVVCERFYHRSTADNAANSGHGRVPGSTGAGSVAAAAVAASKTGMGPAPSSLSAGLNNDGFVSEIVDTVRDWIQQPSALYTSPEVFSLVDFDALYAGYPLQSQEQNQQQDDVTPILSTITIEKAHMILGHQGYPLLKRVTKAQLQNQIMNPTCQHTKGHSKTPADLELDKELFNEELKKMRMRDQEGLRKQIGPVWKHVEEALERMEGAERVRSGILGTSRAKDFAQTYKDRLVSFQEVWTSLEAAVKKPSSKKKVSASDNVITDPVTEIDQGFQQFIDNMQHVHKQLTADVLESSERSLREFIKELAAAQTKILKLALTRIQEGKVGTARIDKILEESPEKCRNALKMVEQLIPIFDTKMGQFRVLVLNKLKEVDEEVESVAAAYFQDSQKTVQGRLEKATNKEFRRRIKKLEFLSVETRKWFFQSRLTLFSDLDFATVCLNTLGILMEEAEVLEAVQLGLHDDHFRSRVLKSQEGRMKLAQQFREGIKTGRRVLAVMVSRLMMREGARAMGEMAAIQKEKKFLKSIGQDVSDTKFSTKGFLVPSRDASPTASAHVSDDEDAEGPSGATAVSKSKKKKDKKKKKAAEASAAAAAVIPLEVEVEASSAGSTTIEEANRDDTLDLRASTFSGLIPNSVEEPLSAMSSKEARELKKQAKKDAKRQAKEAAEAEETAAAQEAAKRAEDAQRLKEMKEAQEAIERQEAKELKAKRDAEELVEQKRVADEARVAEAARVAKAAEDAVARQREQESKEVREAVERERKQAQKESKEVQRTSFSDSTATASTSHSTPAATPTAPAATSGSSQKTEAKVPTWGPSASTLANRAAQAAREAERASKKRFSGERIERAPDMWDIGDSKPRHTNGTVAHQDRLPADQAASPVRSADKENVQPTTSASVSAAEPEPEDNGMDNVEDLARLPTQALVSLVHTLQVENKSLLTTLVSMQQQVSSLTERYSTLASLAREHEQQAIQAMEAQKQREMEEVQRYVWKVEERCRQLEKHVLATHQHRMQMQQMQHQQQFQQQQHHQQHQQQQSLVSGPPGMPSAGNLSMPPPGFNNLLGLGRQPSAPSSPSMAHHSANGLDSSSAPSSISTAASTSSMGYSNMMMSSANGSMESLMSPQVGSMSGSLLPASSGGVAPPGYESGPKKTHWRQRGEVRCGNCAQLGHASADCQAGCRYCDEPGHLSQDCPRMATTHV